MPCSNMSPSGEIGEPLRRRIPLSTGALVVKSL